MGLKLGLSSYGNTLRVFGIRMLREILGPKRKEVTGDRRKLDHDDDDDDDDDIDENELCMGDKNYFAGYVLLFELLSVLQKAYSVHVKVPHCFDTCFDST
jgi:hypothetical protein